MDWKQNLLGTINVAISRRKNAIFAVCSVEQKEWGEFIVEDIFSTLHLFKPLKLDFIVLSAVDQDRFCVGDVIEKKGDDSMIRMTGMTRRVVHKEFGAGEIISMGVLGQLPVAFIKFDGSKYDETVVLREDLEQEIIDGNDPKLKIKHQDEIKSKNKIDNKERKLAHVKELERIQADALAEAKEIEDMSNETLVDEFERLIRGGAGCGYRRVVFMKRDMVKRMNRGDHL